MQVSTRSAWSCETCRKRKVRCDSQNPCTNCVRRREECTWADNAQLRPPTGQVADQATQLQELQERVSHLEAILSQAGHLHTRSCSAVAGARPSSDYDESSASSGTTGRSQLGSTTARTSSHNRQQISIESAQDNAGSSRQEDPRSIAIEDLTAAHQSSMVHSEVHKHDDFDHHIIGGPTAALHSGDGSQNLTTTRAKDLLSRCLPVKAVADQLLQSYLLNVEWIHHPLDVPYFEAEYSKFWHAHGTSGSLPDAQWLALLLIVLCLGNHFASTHLQSSEEDVLYRTAQEMLTLSNHLANHSITAIQTLILMGLWLNNRGMSNTHHAQLALAIKMAMNLGLGKLDSSTRPPKDGETLFLVYDKSLSSTTDVKSEMKRRLWWSLLCQDYYTSSSCNFTYMIQPQQCRTDFFLNLDEHDLPRQPDRISNVVVPKLDEVACSASYHLLKIPFAKTAKDMTDLLNADALSYKDVLFLEKCLWDTYNQLPDHFKWDWPTSQIPASQHVISQHLEWQRLFLGFTVHNRVLRLHRPFMAHGYSNPRMLQSRHATIRSATACIRLAEKGRAIEFPGLRWWVVLVHIFTAAVALCIDYHFLIQYRRSTGRETELSQLTHSRRQQISIALKLLRQASIHSVAAQRAVTVIDKLVMQAESHGLGSGATGRKRRQQTPSPTDASSSSANIVLPTTSAMPFAYAQSPAQASASVQADQARLANIETEDNSSTALDTQPNAPASTTSFTRLEDNVFLSPEYSLDDDFRAIEPREEDRLATIQMEEWSGPDWEQLLASMSNTAYSPTAGLSTDLYNTVSSFADSFAPWNE